jgi:rubrerythrin
VTYDLVSVLYHSLQGAETYEIFVADAEEAGDQELAQFFNDVMEEERRRADRAKALLASRLNK